MIPVVVYGALTVLCAVAWAGTALIDRELRLPRPPWLFRPPPPGVSVGRLLELTRNGATT